MKGHAGRRQGGTYVSGHDDGVLRGKRVREEGGAGCRVEIVPADAAGGEGGASGEGAVRGDGHGDHGIGDYVVGHDIERLCLGGGGGPWLPVGWVWEGEGEGGGEERGEEGEEGWEGWEVEMKMRHA